MSTMTRDALLQLAAQHTDPAPAATEMARRMTSAEHVQAATTTLSQQAASLEQWAGVVGGASALSILTAMVSGAVSTLRAAPAYGSEPSPVALAVLVAMVVFFCTTCLYFTLSDKAETLRKQLELLKPVVGAKECGRALEYVEAGFPAVLAWHALAVAERGVLAKFDVAVLRDLHYAAKAASADEAARQKLYARTGVTSSQPRGVPVRRRRQRERRGTEPAAAQLP